MKSNISKFQLAFTLIELLVVISIIAILASIALPTFTKVIERGNQTKDLSNAKQVYLGLKMYAGDNDGVFPVATANSNSAFRQLVPNYVPSESVFYLAKSAWTPKAPDENTSDDANRLKGGENHFAYVNNLSDTSIPSLPIIADGFKDAATAVYSAVETEKGGVWKGRAAIVVRVDGSGKVEKCDANFAVLGPVGTSSNANIFTTTGTNWLAATQVPVNPETSGS